MNKQSERISRLSPVQQALLEKTLREKTKRLSSQRTISKREKSESPPFSSAQARIWFLEQLDPGNIAYNRPSALRFIGRLDTAVLERCLNDIVRRHEVLRCSFPDLQGNPVPVISPTSRIALVRVNLAYKQENQKEAEAQRLAVEEAQKPFDLIHGPLVRATLLQLNETDHILLLTIHHIIFDEWSMQVLRRELSVIYEAFSAGQPSPLSELPIQYWDFAQWQNERLRGEALETDLEFWKKQLDGAPPISEFPTDRPRPNIQTFRGATHSIILPKNLCDSVKSLSRREDVTLFMTLLAAFKILMYRYSGSDDIVVGIPVAGRDRLETEPLIGVFINTLALRTHLTGNPTFRELLGCVRRASIDGYSHQELPFEQLIEKLQIVRDLGRSPLFQTLFDFRNIPKQTREIRGLEINSFEFDSGIALVDLSLGIILQGDVISCKFTYNTDLFEASTIERISEHYHTLLAGIVANPEQKLLELPLLTEAERHMLLVEWNNTSTDYPGDKCVHELFEEQVERTPDSTAVVFEDQQLTYRELNSRANHLAHYLIKQGVGPEVLVGLCVERSLEMIIGVLGILKAGGAYVPLDPSCPRERLRLMLEDTDIAVLLTQKRLCAGLPLLKAKLVCLDSDWNEIARESVSNLTNTASLNNAVYVIYTSGSTGKPKGVVIQHGSLANFTGAAISQYGIGPSDRILQFASINFDASAEEIYPCLACGATLMLRTDEMLSSVIDFLKKCEEWELTVLSLPTAYWNELTRALDTDNLRIPRLIRLVIIGGEKASPERLTQWHQHVGTRLRLLNTYGPTEATVVTTLCDLTYLDSGDKPAKAVPIGRPMPNVQIYILDPSLQPVPIRTSGELHIGGKGLARGYLKRPELTAEKFIPDPFSEEPGARLYRTGDLARYLPDGTIEFMGRTDSQVKVRGYRIELGEIETVLRQYPAIRDSAIIVREDQPGNKQLVAYVVPNENSAVRNHDLRNFLKQQLPDYMVPSAFVVLDSLPLTPSGKVDRRALPAPDSARPGEEDSYVAPRTPIEEVLAGIWCEVLEINQVGVHDNFFELGGHSLLATQVISRMRNAFEVQIPLRSLFEHSTIAGLAVEIIQSQVEITGSDELALLLAELEVSAPGPVFRFKEIEDETDE
jgi:amino acid adenylation domain-containing protein